MLKANCDLFYPALQEDFQPDSVQHEALMMFFLDRSFPTEDFRPNIMTNAHIAESQVRSPHALDMCQESVCCSVPAVRPAVALTSSFCLVLLCNPVPCQTLPHTFISSMQTSLVMGGEGNSGFAGGLGFAGRSRNMLRGLINQFQAILDIKRGVPTKQTPDKLAVSM